MRYTPSTLPIAAFAPEQSGLGNFQVKQNASGDNTSLNGTNPPQSKPDSTPPSADRSHPQDRAAGEQNDTKRGPAEKELALADTGFQASNNDDSAIDLEDDPMLMSVGKYGDMMLSDPADAEGDVVVI